MLSPDHDISVAAGRSLLANFLDSQRTSRVVVTVREGRLDLLHEVKELRVRSLTRRHQHLRLVITGEVRSELIELLIVLQFLIALLEHEVIIDLSSQNI